MKYNYTTCKDCKGTGKKIRITKFLKRKKETNCSWCHGSGKHLTSFSLDPGETYHPGMSIM
jgi:DnaJ-class molecular chaperone